jgi:hypothetical protein
MTKHIKIAALTFAAALALTGTSWAAGKKKARPAKEKQTQASANDPLAVDLAQILKDPKLTTPLFQTAKKECYCVAYEYRKTKFCVDPGPNNTCRAWEWREVEVCVKEHCHYTAD